MPSSRERADQTTATEPRPPRGGTQDFFYAHSVTTGLPRIVRGDGIYLWDASGTQYIDAVAGVYLTSLGQGNERVLAAMLAQGRKLTFSYVRNSRHDPNLELVERITGLAGNGYERVHLSSGGSDANEMAIKFLRQYAVATARSSRQRVISCMPSYHGASLGAIAMNGDDDVAAVYGPMVTLSEKIPAPLTYRAESPESAARASAAALEELILNLGAETVLAFVVEPIGGQASGANVPHPLFFSEIRSICDRYGVWLVYDEVMSAIRCGRFLAAHFQKDAAPDLIVLAKGLGSGYAPLGAVLAPASMVDELAELTGFNLSHTYNANPISCAAGCAVLDEIVDRDLIPHAEEVGLYLRDGLVKLAADSPVVGDVRGRGLLLGLELVASKETQAIFRLGIDPADRARQNAARRGLMLYARRQNAGRFGDWLVIAPPLIVTRRDCDEIVERLGLALNDFTREMQTEGALG